MSFDLKRIVDSKRTHRRHLAARPVAEKLMMLDMLRERTVNIRAATLTKNFTTTDLQDSTSPKAEPARQNPR